MPASSAWASIRAWNSVTASVVSGAGVVPLAPASSPPPSPPLGFSGLRGVGRSTVVVVATRCGEQRETAEHACDLYQPSVAHCLVCLPLPSDLGRCGGRPYTRFRFRAVHAAACQGRLAAAWPPSSSTSATPSCASFDATVLAVDGDRVDLDRTAFYATGGGQPHDTGTPHVGRRLGPGRRGAQGGRRRLAPPRGRRAARWAPRCTARSTGSGATP